MEQVAPRMAGRRAGCDLSASITAAIRPLISSSSSSGKPFAKVMGFSNPFF